MPELPEVETVRADLSGILPQKQVVAIKVFDSKLINEQELQQFVGNKIESLSRKGKYLLIHFFNTDQYILLHLRMTGQLIFRSETMIIGGGHPSEIDIPNLPDKATRLQLTFGDGSSLFFRDSRRFGTVEVGSLKNLAKQFQRFGIEPLTSNWKLSEFTKRLSGRKTSIKAALLNQELFFGFGNIYADEVCFRAGVLPMRLIPSLTQNEIRKLFHLSSEVMQEAIENRGTSFKDFMDTKGRAGTYAEKLQVYGRKGEHCYVCDSPISKINHSGRGTHYCVRCQK